MCHVYEVEILSTSCNVFVNKKEINSYDPSVLFLFSYVNRPMCVHITSFLFGVVISSMDGSFIIVR